MGDPSIVVDPTRFDRRCAGEVTHNLSDHPLLTIEKLRKLASRLSDEHLRWHSGHIPIGTNFARAAADHPNGRSLDDTLASIEEAGSWVFLQHIERDPDYADLVQHAVGSVAPHVTPSGRVQDIAGWVFIASPCAVTPYHLDHETNILLQVRGTKLVHVWDPSDRAVVGERELECLHGHYSLDETHWRDELASMAATFAVRPGVGVFMPFTAPHAVNNDDNVSVTVSLTFLTRENRREQRAFAANCTLRSLGLVPRPVGRSPRRDALKGSVLDIGQRCRRLVRRHPSG